MGQGAPDQGLHTPCRGRDLPRFASLNTVYRLPGAPFDAAVKVALAGVLSTGGGPSARGDRFAA